MINPQKTLEKFGYEPAALTFGSKKKIVVTCDYCNTDFDQVKAEQTKVVGKAACCKCRKIKMYETIRSTEGKMEEIKKKRLETVIRTTGSNVPSGCKKMLEGRAEKFKERYGVDHYNKLPEAKEKIKKTNRERYGVDYPCQNANVKKKQIATTMKKYGVSNPFQVPAFQQKACQTNIARYGHAYPINLFGAAEKDFIDSINSMGANFTPDPLLLAPKHLDGHDRERKIAVEYCGLYWHNESVAPNRNKYYHHFKYKKCKDSGVQLITIFEDEWLNNRNGVLNHIRSVCNLNTNIIDGRDCEFRKIDNAVGMDFIHQNHIQGLKKVPQYAFGLYHNEELVGCVTFYRNTRSENPEDVVLTRMAFKSNTTIRGGASKLIENSKPLLIQDGFKTIVTWSDNRYSEGNIYKVMGFTFVKESLPDYTYVNLSKCVKRISKQNFRTEFQNQHQGLKESEKADLVDHARIWDCGKKKWTLKL